MDVFEFFQELKFRFLDKAGSFSERMEPLLLFATATFLALFALVQVFQIGSITVSNGPNVFTAALVSPKIEPSKETTIKINLNGAIDKVGIKGVLRLNGQDSMVRVDLIDTNGNKYQIYEASGAKSALGVDINLDGACQQTCQFGPVKPDSIKIKSKNATFFLESYSF